MRAWLFLVMTLMLVMGREVRLAPLTEAPVATVGDTATLLWSRAVVWNGPSPSDGDDVIIDANDLGDFCSSALTFFLLILDVPSPELRSFRTTQTLGPVDVEIRGCRTAVRLLRNTLRATRVLISNSSFLFLDAATIKADQVFVESQAMLAGSGVIDAPLTRMSLASMLMPGLSSSNFGGFQGFRECCWPGWNASLPYDLPANMYGTLNFLGDLTITTSTAIWIKSLLSMPLQQEGRLSPLADVDRISCKRFTVEVGPGFGETSGVSDPTLSIYLIGGANASSLFLTWETFSIDARVVFNYEYHHEREQLNGALVACQDYCPVSRVDDPNYQLPALPGVCDAPTQSGLGVLLDSGSGCMQASSCPPCQNGGFCVAFLGVCSCPTEFGGGSCQTAVSNATGTSTPAAPVDALTLGLAIGIPLAVVAGAAIALGIVFYKKWRTDSYTRDAQKEIRLELQQ